MSISTKIDAQTGQMTVNRGEVGSVVEKSAQGGAAIEAMFGGGGSSGTSVSKAYNASVWVYAAVNLRTSPLCSAKLQFFADRDLSEVTQVPEWSWWDRPARTKAGPMDLDRLLTLTESLLCLDGVAFWILDDTWLDRSRSVLPSPMILAAKSAMRDVYRGDELVGWVYRDGAGRSHHLLAEQVIVHAMPNPHDINAIGGVSPLVAAKLVVEEGIASSKFAKRMADNNGDLGQIISSKNPLQSEQVDQIVAMLEVKRRHAKRGDFRPAFFSGDVSVTEPKVNAVGGSFLEQKRGAAEEIFIAFGIPASMTTQVASYSVGSASDWYRLIVDTVMPQGERLCKGISLVSEYLTGARFVLDDVERGLRGTPVYANLDFSGHPVMAQVRIERMEVATKLHDRGVPWSVADQSLGLGLGDFDGKETAFLPANRLPVDAPASSVEPAAKVALVGSGKTGSAVDDLVKLMSAKVAGPVFVTSPKTKADDAARLAQWTALDARREWARKRFFSVFNKELQKARKETLENLSNATSLKSPVTKAGVVDLLFDLGKWSEGLRASMRKVTLAVVETAGQELIDDEVDDYDDPFEAAASDTLQILADADNRTADIAENVWKEVGKAMQEGVDEGDSIEVIADRVRARFTDMSKHRARTIARTETTVAYEGARYLAMKQAGIEFKEWLTARDEDVREAHLHADRQVRKLSRAFDVDEEKLMMPGDPNGSPGNVINCRCIGVASLATEEVG